MSTMKKIAFASLLLLFTTYGVVRAETNILEASAPNGWVFQYFNIYQHGSGFEGDKLPFDDMNLDVSMNLFRVAYWDTNYVAHAIVPYGYVNQEVGIGGANIIDANTDGLGDIYLGGAYRFNGENKDCWLLTGMDLKLPTGRYDADKLPNPQIGSGSTSFQPFVIYSQLHDKGAWGHDTEIRYDFNSKLGEVNYNPDDMLEIWQTLHFGVAENLRAGLAVKGEFVTTDDNNDTSKSRYIGAGPEIMWHNDKGIVVWAKLLFDLETEDYPKNFTSFTLRLSMPF